MTGGIGGGFFGSSQSSGKNGTMSQQQMKAHGDVAISAFNHLLKQLPASHLNNKNMVNAGNGIVASPL